jgi:hypothetical protein
MLLLLLLVPVAATLLPAAAAAAPSCPAGAATRTAEFERQGVAWAACEDVQRRDGALALVSAAGAAEWFTRGYDSHGW